MIHSLVKLYICGIFTFMIMVLAGCKTRGPNIDSVGFSVPPRTIYMSTFGLNWPDSFEEYPGYFSGDTVVVKMQVLPGGDDFTNPPLELASKVEVDPGDGSGWLDFTQGWKDTFVDTFGNVAGTHIFVEPGLYSMSLRLHIGMVRCLPTTLMLLSPSSQQRMGGVNCS